VTDIGSRARLAVTLGDPAGIGPEVLLGALVDSAAFAALTPEHGTLEIHGSRAILARVARERGLAPAWLDGGDPRITVIEGPPVDGDLARGAPSALAGRLAFAYLERAVDRLVRGEADALVTLPVNKHAWSLAGVPWTDHTGYLAHRAGAVPVMAFDSPRIRLALATIHLPLRGVAGALTAAGIVRVARALDRSLREDHGIARPRLAILGLNPHAGEDGLLGDEDHAVVAPAISELVRAGVDAYGPLPPDTAFIPPRLAGFDGWVAMYHDQGLAPFKALAFHDSCQVTLGLPWVRTSVDHGTAFDLVGTGRASPASFVRALGLAARLAVARRARR